MLSSAHLPRIAVIVGSNRRDSTNRKLAQALVRLGAGKFEAAFVRIDDLPMYNQVKLTCRRKRRALRTRWRAPMAY
jgi:NAD(P)H-dependent FMN reductase